MPLCCLLWFRVYVVAKNARHILDPRRQKFPATPLHACGSSRVTSVCVLVDVTAPSRDLDLRQQLPSLDESFAEPKYRTPSPANFLGDQLYLLTRFHGRFSVVSVSVCDVAVSCVLMFCWTWRQTSVSYVFTNTFSVLVCIWLLHVWFLTLSVLFFSFGR